MSEAVKYAICCTQRSGSTFLCSLLSRAGLGVPAEYCYPESAQERIAAWSLDKAFRPAAGGTGRDFIEAVIRAQGRVAGVKLNWLSLLVFMRDMGGRPEELGYRLIYLVRRDKLRQAISWYRAVVTGQWARCGQGAAPAPEFDWHKINFWLQNITLDEARWEHYLQRVNCPVLRLTYEEFTDSTVAEVGEFLGTPVPARKRESEFSVQRDDVTDQWVELFLKAANSDVILSSEEMRQQLAIS